MAFDIKSTLETLEDWLKKSGYFPKAAIGEPKQPPQEETSAAVFMNRVSTIRVFANGGLSEVHLVTVRVYRNMLAEPQQDIELDLARLISSDSSDLVGDFTMGGAVMALDVAGMHGTPYGATWGYLDVGGKMYRIVDILAPFIVNDSATAAP